MENRLLGKSLLALLALGALIPLAQAADAPTLNTGSTAWMVTAAVLVLFMLTAPWLVDEYWLAQLTFVLIYAIVGLGLMLLAGFTGLFSLGHAAFLGVGAYTQAVMVNAGLPFPLALACAALLSAAVGMVVGLPALRVKGIYLGMATLAFGFIVEEGMARWESVTGGNKGLMVGYPNLFGWELDSTNEFYFLCLVVCVGSTLAIVNLMRSSTGRAFVAIRDSEISAQSMGIHLARYKTISFALSAAITGIAGALLFDGIALGGQDQDRCGAVFGIGARALDEAEAVETRHVDVGHDDVGIAFLENFQALDAVFGLDGLEASIVEGHQKHVSDGSGVIHGKHFFLHCRISLASR